MNQFENLKMMLIEDDSIWKFGDLKMK